MRDWRQVHEYLRHAGLKHDSVMMAEKGEGGGNLNGASSTSGNARHYDDWHSMPQTSVQGDGNSYSATNMIGTMETLAQCHEHWPNATNTGAMPRTLALCHEHWLYATNIGSMPRSCETRAGCQRRPAQALVLSRSLTGTAVDLGIACRR
ncbi:hypothetical protein DENSPDRAFT_558054 [Dentipellis sp. KUC8613]|nr:hypothetical protein DENSPDRAFT_558054 [Dentipellis sp. KUC8613]